jgi:hypothetical protein
MIVDSRGGLTLHVERVHHGPLSWLRRRWQWWVDEADWTPLDGMAWTFRTAIIHGSTCRALMIAARSPVATRRPQDDLEGWR